MSPKIHAYTVPRQQIWTQNVILRRPPFLFSYVMQVIAIIAVVAFVFGLWIAVSTRPAPRASYPYYDTRKPVPQWSEPTPLEGNRDKGGQ